jgi:hypothetical protein
MDEVYLKYYQSQAGGGIADIGELYHISPKFHQRGRGGVGSFFSGIFRHLKPLISSGLRALKRQTIKTSANIIKDLGEKPIKNILIEEGRAAVDELSQKGIKKLNKLQDGEGTAHSFTFKNLGKNIKRRFHSKENQSVVPIKKQRTIQRRKPRSKKQSKDIFSD